MRILKKLTRYIYVCNICVVPTHGDDWNMHQYTVFILSPGGLNYYAPWRGVKCCDEYVCLSVCPLAYLQNHRAKLHYIFMHVAMCYVLLVCGHVFT